MSHKVIEPRLGKCLEPNSLNSFSVCAAKLEPRGTLVGSNAAVNSVDFDSMGTMVLATSNDYASRVWTIADQRLRVSALLASLF